MPDDPLDDLRAQVRATQAAAERLMGSGVPPKGWEPPREGGAAFGEEVQALAGLLTAIRDVVPPDLREQVTDLVRQLLLVLRALLDWLVTRIEEHSAASTGGGGSGVPSQDRVQDIPIA
jgi:hypothetical protein